MVAEFRVDGTIGIFYKRRECTEGGLDIHVQFVILNSADPEGTHRSGAEPLTVRTRPKELRTIGKLRIACGIPAQAHMGNRSGAFDEKGGVRLGDPDRII